MPDNCHAAYLHMACTRQIFSFSSRGLSHNRSISHSQIESSAECDPMLSVLRCSIFYFPYGYPTAVYVFFIIFSFLLSFLQRCTKGRQSLRSMWPIQLTFPRFIAFIILHTYLTLYDTFRFFTRPDQLILSVLPQHHKYLIRLLNTLKLSFCLIF